MAFSLSKLFLAVYVAISVHKLHTDSYKPVSLRLNRYRLIYPTARLYSTHATVGSSALTSSSPSNSRQLIRENITNRNATSNEKQVSNSTNNPKIKNKNTAKFILYSDSIEFYERNDRYGGGADGGIKNKHDITQSMSLNTSQKEYLRALVGKTTWARPTIEKHDWEIHYAALLEHYKEHGTCNVPQAEVYECYLEGSNYHYVGRLGGWLHRQRQAKKGTGNNKITPERQALLQKLVDEGKLAWELETVADMKKKQGDIDWPRNYAALLEYYKEHGTCNVYQVVSYECDLEGLGESGGVHHYVGKLGTWLMNQRKAKKGQSKHKLTPERKGLLQKLVDEGKLDWELEGISEISKKQGDIDWPRHYAALLEYYKEHGTCNVPQSDSYECDLEGLGENGGVYHYVGNLGRWLDRQRQAKKGKGNFKIIPERLAMLQKLVDEGKLRWSRRSIGGDR